MDWSQRPRLFFHLMAGSGLLSAAMLSLLSRALGLAGFWVTLNFSCAGLLLNTVIWFMVLNRLSKWPPEFGHFLLLGNLAAACLASLAGLLVWLLLQIWLA